MVDIVAGKKIGEALKWLNDLGEEDTEKIRAETAELLIHCSATLRSLVELNNALQSVGRKNFADDFLDVYFHCISNYTNPEAALKARTHCTDIRRDLDRIAFKLAKLLRTELGKWKQVGSALSELADADEDFLDRFEGDMQKLTAELDRVASLVADDKLAEAWDAYETLRKPILDSAIALRQEIETMKAADKRFRGNLT